MRVVVGSGQWQVERDWRRGEEGKSVNVGRDLIEI